MASVVASAEGWNDIFLGQDLPAHDIVHSVLQTKARALALSIIHPCDDPLLPLELYTLQEHLPTEIPILIGGACASAYKECLRSASVHQVDSLSALRSQLAEIRMDSGAG